MKLDVLRHFHQRISNFPSELVQGYTECYIFTPMLVWKQYLLKSQLLGPMDQSFSVTVMSYMDLSLTLLQSARRTNLKLTPCLDNEIFPLELAVRF